MACQSQSVSLSPHPRGPDLFPVPGDEELAAALSMWRVQDAQGTADSVDRTPEGQSSAMYTPGSSGHWAVPRSLLKARPPTGHTQADHAVSLGCSPSDRKQCPGGWQENL